MKFIKIKKINIKLWVKSYLWKIILYIGGVYIASSLGQMFSSFNAFVFEKIKSPFIQIYEGIVSVINIRIPIYSLIIGLLFVWIVGRLYIVFESRYKKFRIIEAIYGKNDKYVDITDKLNDMIDKDKLRVILSNSISGDPIIGTVKEGIIKYKYDGKKKEQVYKEGDIIELP